MRLTVCLIVFEFVTCSLSFGLEPNLVLKLQKEHGVSESVFIYVRKGQYKLTQVRSSYLEKKRNIDLSRSEYVNLATRARKILWKAKVSGKGKSLGCKSVGEVMIDSQRVRVCKRDTWAIAGLRSMLQNISRR